MTQDTQVTQQSQNSVQGLIDSARTGVGLAVAAVAIVGFAVLMTFLFQNIAAGEPMWDRYVYLYGGVEAIVFAAVGWLFGTQVHRDRAALADTATKTAQAASALAAQEQQKGLSLAHAVLSYHGRTEDRHQIYQSLHDDFAGSQVAKALSFGSQPLSDLMAFAERLYPSVT